VGRGPRLHAARGPAWQGHTDFEDRLDAAPDAAAGAAESGAQRSVLPLQGRQGHRQGLLVLQHEADDGHRDQAFQHFAQRLSGMLAVSIETRQLIESQQNLLDALIRLMADAIDAKSPYTGGHCERVPELATC
jgi:HD-GYP domain-containing protein (c-di-GMP phosphodiesterase class II)